MASRLFRNPNFLNKLKNLKIQKRSSHHDHHVSKLEVDLQYRNTMDMLPQPKGSWKEFDAHRQSINNATLITGILLFTSALIGPASMGMWKNTFFSPPTDKINKDFPGAKFV